MTTIATDGKSMAGDGIATIAGTIVKRKCRKVERLPCGSLFGGAGDAGEIAAIRKWILDGEDPAAFPSDLKESSALVLRPDGRVYSFDHQCHGFPDELDLPVALGAGEQYAMGAMDAGASPRKAIRIASRRSPHTGGKIVVLKLKEKK